MTKSREQRLAEEVKAATPNEKGTYWMSTSEQLRLHWRDVCSTDEFIHMPYKHQKKTSEEFYGYIEKSFLNAIDFLEKEEAKKHHPAHQKNITVLKDALREADTLEKMFNKFNEISGQILFSYPEAERPTDPPWSLFEELFKKRNEYKRPWDDLQALAPRPM
ncbi:uncharacterized protein KY384_000386 [Bacidia gigantensis]|uniref:uncharacterized protein n=1 Tax=Bacidia gigantensis TaxID=2732470 RepID=UPI001D0439D1|nr:uncharacterized protein KY384_000386 [Bacidia gigantensis]KAG8526392.1 hypothetical protein KY384_000386 [Bacidia gigantensis]